MTPELEIVDSAIKIGLGALISSVATYLVTRRNHQHELAKLGREDRRNLIREVSTTLEDGISKLNRGIHCYWQLQKGSAADLESMLDAVNIINRAKALAAISGSDQLMKSVESLSQIVRDLYAFLGRTPGNVDITELNEFIDKLRAGSDEIRPVLTTAYQSIWAPANSK